MKANDIFNGTSREDLNVKAFLSMIRKCEGTDSAKGYQTMFTYKTFTDMSRHPNIKNCANGYCSTAAGAYQFVIGTWRILAVKLGLTDFTPASQDKAAIELIRQEGALDAIMAGDIKTAIDKCQNQWASLPDVPGGEKDANYKQPRKTLSQCIAWYQSAGGNVA